MLLPKAPTKVSTQNTDHEVASELPRCQRKEEARLFARLPDMINTKQWLRGSATFPGSGAWERFLLWIFMKLMP